MDRPSRKTKTVNYCEAKDFDDDDDFAGAKAPPGKKAREDAKREQGKPSCKPSSQESRSAASQKSRRPPDERQRERDLEAAITLATLNDAGVDSNSRSIRPGDANPDPTRRFVAVDGHSTESAFCLGLDEIAPGSLRSSRRSEEQRETRPDEDYKPGAIPDSERDDEESAATENEQSERPPAPAQGKQHPSGSAPARSPPPTAKAASKRPAWSKTAFSPRPAGGGTPKWTPPGRIGTSPNSSRSPAAKSPGQGLRLGLSRAVRVKPLHPGAASR